MNKFNVNHRASVLLFFVSITWLLKTVSSAEDNNQLVDNDDNNPMCKSKGTGHKGIPEVFHHVDINGKEDSDTNLLFWSAQAACLEACCTYKTRCYGITFWEAGRKDSNGNPVTGNCRFILHPWGGAKVVNDKQILGPTSAEHVLSQKQSGVQHWEVRRDNKKKGKCHDRYIPNKDGDYIYEFYKDLTNLVTERQCTRACCGRPKCQASTFIDEKHKKICRIYWIDISDFSKSQYTVKDQWFSSTTVRQRGRECLCTDESCGSEHNLNCLMMSTATTCWDQYDSEAEENLMDWHLCDWKDSDHDVSHHKFNFTADFEFRGNGFCRQATCNYCLHSFKTVPICISSLEACAESCENNGGEQCRGVAFAAPEKSTSCPNQDEGRCFVYQSTDEDIHVGGVQSSHDTFSCWSLNSDLYETLGEMKELNVVTQSPTPIPTNKSKSTLKPSKSTLKPSDRSVQTLRPSRATVTVRPSHQIPPPPVNEYPTPRPSETPSKYNTRNPSSLPPTYSNESFSSKAPSTHTEAPTKMNTNFDLYDRVMADYQRRGHWYPATIWRVGSYELYDVFYDDGDFEEDVPASYMYDMEDEPDTEAITELGVGDPVMAWSSKSKKWELGVIRALKSLQRGKLYTVEFESDKSVDVGLKIDEIRARPVFANGDIVRSRTCYWHTGKVAYRLGNGKYRVDVEYGEDNIRPGVFHFGDLRADSFWGEPGMDVEAWIEGKWREGFIVEVVPHDYRGSYYFIAVTSSGKIVKVYASDLRNI